MEEKKKRSFISDLNNFIGLFYLFAILIIIGLVVVIMYKNAWNSKFLEGKYIEYNNGWHLQSDVEDCGEIQLPETFNQKDATVYKITNTLPDGLTDLTVMCIRASQQLIDVYVEDELVYSYPEEDYLYFGKTYGSSWCFVEMQPEWSGKDVSVEFTSHFDRFRGMFGKIYIGSRNGIVNSLMYKYGIPMFIGIVIIIFSMVFILYYFMLKLYGRNWKQLLYLGLSAFSLAIWIVCENKLKQFVFGNVVVCNMLAFLCLILIPVPFLLCVNELEKGRHKKIILPLTLIVIIDFFIQIILYLKNVFDLLEMTFVSHILMIVTIVVIIGTLIETYHNKKNRDIASYGLCFTALVIFALGEIVSFYLNERPEQMGIFLSIGCLIFISMQGYFSVYRVMELITEREKAIAANEAKTFVLSQVNHEIRTPLNAIFGMNQMILTEDINDNVRNYASNIKAASDTLESLVNEILDFSRIEEGKTVLVNIPYNFKNMLNEVIWMVKFRIATKDIQFIYNIPENIPEKYMGDELRIKQILLNLLVNAVKYTDRGYVKLDLTCVVGDGNVDFTYKVADSGRGIPEDEIHHIFDRFVRVNEKNNLNIEGTGLGLTITKELLECMGGSINVESIYGQGTIFTIKYRQKIVPASETIKTSKKSDAEIFKDRNILVVDDSTTNLAVIAGVLKNTGIHVDCVISGDKCLEAVEKTAYDLIFMDYLMPHMSGVLTLNNLRKLEGQGKVRHKIGQTRIPVVVLTANGTAIDREQCKNEGFDEFVSKPVKKDVLMEVIKRFLDED